MTTGAPGCIAVAFRGDVGQFHLDAAFTVPAAGLTAIFGPSGCGKTTVVRCIAGLQHLPGSFCAIDGEVWQDAAQFRPPHRRSIGYVFQEASLFPHLSVRRNLLYGAPRAPLAAPREVIGFDEVVSLLGLGALLERAPHNLSGGERQRVAIGRALLSQPRLLLMDEPLSALDQSARAEILPFLEKLHERLALPAFYISHDIAEIEQLADHLVLMERGKVIATGPLHELQSNPTLPLALAREAAVSLDAKVEAYDATDALVTLRVGDSRLLVPAKPKVAGARQRLRIAASDVSLARMAPNGTSILNILPARIVSCSTIGPGERLVVVALGAEGHGPRLLSRITHRSWDTLALAEGMAIFAQVKGVSLISGSTAPA
jgi:molybdate transport system ATP-binding protein